MLVSLTICKLTALHMNLIVYYKYKKILTLFQKRHKNRQNQNGNNNCRTKKVYHSCTLLTSKVAIFVHCKNHRSNFRRGPNKCGPSKRGCNFEVKMAQRRPEEGRKASEREDVRPTLSAAHNRCFRTEFL